MSLIHCTSDCVYQKEGYCRLEKAAEVTGNPDTDGCPHRKTIQNNVFQDTEDEKKNE